MIRMVKHLSSGMKYMACILSLTEVPFDQWDAVVSSDLI